MHIIHETREKYAGKTTCMTYLDSDKNDVRTQQSPAVSCLFSCSPGEGRAQLSFYRRQGCTSRGILTAATRFGVRRQKLGGKERREEMMPPSGVYHSSNMACYCARILCIIKSVTDIDHGFSRIGKRFDLSENIDV